MKFQLIFLTLFVLSNITPSYADNYIPYLNLTNEAEWLYDQERYEDSKKTFELAFKLVERAKYKDVLLYSKILSKENKQEKIYELLKNHLKQTGGLTFRISTDLERLDITLSEKRLQELDQYVDTSSVHYQAELALSNELEKLCDLDQLVRSKNEWKDSIWWVTGNDSTYVSRHQQMLEVDSLNYIKMNELMLEYLPKVENLIMSEFYLSRLLIHMNYKHFTSIENHLFELVKRGLLDPWVFARSKDRSYASQIDCPIYFTHIYDFEIIYCTPLAKIKENRRSIGLSTYYRRPSFSYYITPGRMMKEPFDEFYRMKIEESKE